MNVHVFAMPYCKTLYSIVSECIIIHRAILHAQLYTSAKSLCILCLYHNILYYSPLGIACLTNKISDLTDLSSKQCTSSFTAFTSTNAPSHPVLPSSYGITFEINYLFVVLPLPHHNPRALCHHDHKRWCPL